MTAGAVRSVWPLSKTTGWRPRRAELLEVYTCSLCGNPIFESDEYLAVDCCGEICSECLEGLTAKDFALAALDLKTGAAGTEGR